MNRRQKIIISITGIMLVSLILLGLTYGYYLTTITGNTKEKSITLSIANLKLNYDDGNGLIEAEKIIPGEDIDIKTFSVENTGDAKVENYTVYLDSVENTFIDKKDVLLTLTCKSSKGGNCSGAKMTYPSNSTMLSVNNIEVGEKHNYELKVEFLETNDDQSDNMNKTLSGNIVIKDLRSTDKTSSTLANNTTITLNDNEYISNYRIYGNTEQKLLPDEFQQVEYIKSTGTQYIDMKYAYKINDEIDVEFMLNNNSESIQGVFGNGNSSQYTGVSLYVTALNYLSATVGGTLGSEFYNYPTPINQKEKYKVKLEENKVYLNGNNIFSLTNTLKNGTQEDFSLFRRWGTTTMSGNIYSFSVKRDDKYIFNLVPSYRKTDNVVGMYDLIANKFYTNSGTGVFEKGNNIEAQPTPSTPVEMKSVGEKTKNLLNLDDLLNAPEGELPSSTNTTYTAQNLLVLNLKKNTPYIINTMGLPGSLTDSADTGRSLYINTAETANCVFDGHSVTVTTDNTGIIKIGLFNNRANAEPILNKTAKIQLEEGTTTTDYEPYGYKIPIKVRDDLGNENVTNIYLDEPLRKIDEFADYIDFEKQQVIRQLNKIDLSKYTWLKSGSGTTLFYYISGVSPVPKNSYSRLSVSNILNGNGIDSTSSAVGIHAYVSGIVRARPDLSVYDTLEKWKEYINTNESYLIYPIADKTEAIELPNITLGNGTNHISIDTSILPSNVEFNIIK